MKIPALFIFAVLTLTSAGCHCMPVTERYCDFVDEQATREFCKDKYYNPELDPTRWGMPDGPECFRRKCCR